VNEVQKIPSYKSSTVNLAGKKVARGKYFTIPGFFRKCPLILKKGYSTISNTGKTMSFHVNKMRKGLRNAGPFLTTSVSKPPSCKKKGAPGTGRILPE
jgi:hypothetical protein